MLRCQEVWMPCNSLWPSPYPWLPSAGWCNPTCCLRSICLLCYKWSWPQLCYHVLQLESVKKMAWIDDFCSLHLDFKSCDIRFPPQKWRNSRQNIYIYIWDNLDSFMITGLHDWFARMVCPRQRVKLITPPDDTPKSEPPVEYPAVLLFLSLNLDANWELKMMIWVKIHQPWRVLGRSPIHFVSFCIILVLNL